MQNNLRNLILIILAAYFTACSTQTSNNEPKPSPTVRTNPSATPSPRPSEMPKESEATDVSATSMLVETPAPNVVADPSVSSDNLIATPTLMLQTECPTIIDSSQPLWSEGSILFNKGTIWSDSQPYDVAEQAGIWAISIGNQTPSLVFESSTGGWLSPDGSLFLSIKRDTERLTQEAIIQNLETGEEHRLMIPYTFWFKRWLPDGYIEFMGEIERELGTGESLEILILDPASGQILEQVEKNLVLPGFVFNDSELERFGLFYGYDSLDPSGQLVLYSAQVEGSNDYEIRLLNLQTGEVIWKHESQFLSSVRPQWSLDGTTVLFDISVPAVEGNSSRTVFSLTREGKVGELPVQTFPTLDGGELNGYSRSPSGRYILYTTVETDVETFSAKKRAFVIDTQSSVVGEICLPGTTFLFSIPAGLDSEGFWLPGEQFVYRVLTEKEGQLTHFLCVLDISTWSTQIVFESEPGFGVNSLGWTHVIFSQP